jgi:hypothetical protein
MFKFASATPVALAVAAGVGVNAANTEGEVGEKKKLQVHIIPHTHDDVGWTRTVRDLDDVRE